MERAIIQDILEHSPCIKLLRAKQAHLMLSFFFEVFRKDTTFSISERTLINNLTDYLNFIEFSDVDLEYDITGLEEYEEKAKKLIHRWTENNFLRNYQDENGNIIYELTSYTEKTLQWFSSLEKRDFVGTESRFKDIFNKLRDLVEFSTEDPAKRLQELQARRSQIDEEIENILITKKVEVYDDYQIKSRLSELTQSAKELLSDFREVEENFKTITRQIYQKHTDPTLTKGNILSFAFDALDDLKESEQGKSFYAFWEFLITRSKQDEWRALTFQLFDVLYERGIAFDDHFLRKMKTFLHRNGQKVYDANDRMAEKLSRIISEQEQYERIRVKKTIGLIKELALKVAEKGLSPTGVEFIVEGKPEINLFMERKISLEKPELPEFVMQPQAKEVSLSELSDLSRIFNQEYVDRKKLEKNIQYLLEHQSQVSLIQVVSKFPVEQGLAEIICYLTIAKDKPEKCVICDDHYEDIEFDYQQRKYLRTPQVIYSR